MSDLLPLVIWLIPLLVIAVLACLWIVSRILQQNAGRELKKLRLALRQLQSARKQLEFKSQTFSVNDPEPYQSLAAELHESLASLLQRSVDLERRHVAMHERLSRLQSNPWKKLVQTPTLWRSLRRDGERLKSELTQLQPALHQTASIEQSLQQLPWQVATRVRELHLSHEQVSRLLAGLKSVGLYGDTFESALRQEGQIHTALSQVPPLFFEGSETALLQAAQKADTARTHEIVQINQSALADLLNHARRWESEYKTAGASLAAMRKDLADLAQTFSSLPEGLELSQEQAAHRQMEIIAQNLQATSSRFEVESLPLAVQEAGRVRQAAQEQIQALRLASRQLESLEPLLKELSEGFRQLSLKLAALGAKSVHPIHWEVSLEKLARSNRQANQLGSAPQPRSPAQVDQDFKTAAEINAQQRELSQYFQEIEDAHTELVALLGSPEASQLPKWLQSTRSLAAKAGDYAPENWSRLDDLPSLPAEIDAFSSRVEQLVAGDPSEQVSELEIGARLQQTRQLLEDYHRLAARVENLGLRLEDLQQTETRALEQLEQAQKSLVQIRLIANSNPLLSRAASQEIDRLLREVQNLLEKLENPGRGGLEKKASQARVLYERVQASISHWLEQLNKEILALIKDLTNIVSELDLIARLEDRSLADARRLVSSHPAQSGAQAPGKTRLNLLETVAELKRCSLFWQECLAVQKALENVQPLIETYRETGLQRDQARQQIGASPGWQDRRRTWPPSSASLDTSRQELEQLEAEWQALKQRSGKAIAFVAQYTQLGSRYQTLAERVRQIVAHRQQEQTQVEELDAEIAEQAERWETLLRQYQDNPLTVREIREFLDDLDEALDQIESGYLKSELDYDDVIQRMKTALRRVRFYQVALDDDHALEASGRVIRRLQSEHE